ncbi:hypothetical protein DH2020_012064 [Rehmannia glutinosa]|uniref:Protein BIG GRAIN 1-like E n=1 Tax=Rehmannia glutinosa TaxID=99300 RepID=A0ABR0XFT2_REHGL
MSVTGPNRACKNSFHWKNDSGELDVFEAARYFNENPGPENGAIFSQTFIRENRRISLDSMPMNRINSIHPENDKKKLKENKKYKQPSSPGGRLASFLNSIFNQTNSKKKKSKSGKNIQPDEENEGESPGGMRRKRRSSISHFRINNTNNNSNSSIFSSSGSGFRTPPNYAKTPTKSAYKEMIRKFPGSQKGVALPGNGDGKSRFGNGDVFRNGSFGMSDRNSVITTIWGGDEEIRDFRKLSDVDDGAESDSSSDLFDLPNHGLDFHSSGLPVYGTTHMDRIRIGAPIYSAAKV